MVCSARSMPLVCGETMSELKRECSNFGGPGRHLLQNGDIPDNQAGGVVWDAERAEVLMLRLNIPLCSILCMLIDRALMDEARWGAVSQEVHGGATHTSR